MNSTSELSLVLSKRRPKVNTPLTNLDKWFLTIAITFIAGAVLVVPVFEPKGAQWFRAYFNLGKCYDMKGDFVMAKRYYFLALCSPINIRLNEKALCWHNLGQILAKEGKERQAGRCFLMALELDPNQYQTMVGLAKLLGNKGEYELAIGFLGKALKLSPGYMPGQNLLQEIMKRRRMIVL